MHRLFFVWLLCAAPVLAGINVPAEVRSPPDPIVASVDADIPEGAQSKGLWGISGTGEAALVEVGDGVHIWAQPGTYTLEYRGMWVDFDAKEFDFIDERAEIKVYVGDEPGPDPKPDPDPDPQPTEHLTVVIIEDVSARDELPYGQVQAMTLPDIRELPELFRLVDKDVTGPDGQVPPRLEPYVRAAREAGRYPWMMMVDQDGRSLWEGEVPESAADMRTLIKGWIKAPAKIEKPTAKVVPASQQQWVRRTYCGPRGCYSRWEIAN